MNLGPGGGEENEQTPLTKVVHDIGDIDVDMLSPTCIYSQREIEFASTNVLANLEIYAYIEPNVVSVFAANLAFNLTFDRRIMPEHFALFASEGCPAAIVDVSGTFPDWLPIYRIPVQGKVVEKPPDPTTFRDVIIAVIIVIVYYLVLTNFILPLHFQLWMPLVGFFLILAPIFT
ncbi:unnamed protein product [Nippostrongylus brasiliensis]|uniref:Glucuronosyltransferase n=1 Tax=Nippostrongylus brasiliensis TaxID=27835 RepID=A0A158R096_NIPBR|nr:unnamed protein product [Nippostrongylus brasiliensis]